MFHPLAPSGVPVLPYWPAAKLGPGYPLDRPPESLNMVVAGLGIAGFSAAQALLARGGRVCVIDQAAGSTQSDRAQALGRLGADVRLAAGPELPQGDVLIVSTGIPLDSPWILAAAARGTPVWGEFELAWRLRPASGAAPWLYVTGTNGKTTTTLMLQAILTAAGRRTTAVGNTGISLIDAVVAPEPYEVLAVEVGAPHLPFVYSVSPQAGVCLNLAPDHIDYFGDYPRYAATKATAYLRTQETCVYNGADPATAEMVRAAALPRNCRAVGFTLGVPAAGMLGVVEDLLIDRAFTANPDHQAEELANLADVTPPAPHQIANALAAAALARAHGVPAGAIRQGLKAFTPAAHRLTPLGQIGDVHYVDDSKATNGHAALTALTLHDPVVWIAGGQAKGQHFDELVARAAPRLRAVVLLGKDRGLIRAALGRQAPEVPILDISTSDQTAMARAVRAAAGIARPGDTVLLAPGCASRDMFRDYADRGLAFQRAVSELSASHGRG